MRLLIVEDDLPLASALSDALARRDIGCDIAGSTGDARQMLKAAHYAAMLLDLGLPDGDGVALIESLRAGHDSIPILAVTARTALGDRVRGLNAGADDYLTKPFDADELVARLHAVLRRQGGVAATRLVLGNLEFEPVTGDLWVDGARVTLSARERQLLGLLLRRTGSVVSKQLAEDQLYGLSDPVGSNAVEVHAHRLRRKLDAAGASARIETVRGVGYLMRDHAPGTGD